MPIGEMITSSFERAPWGWPLLGAVLLALIKAWPILNKLAIDAREKLRQEKRDELYDCRTEVTALAARVTTVEATAHGFELKLMGTLNAYRVLETDIASRYPDAVSLIQARRILRDTFGLAEDFIPSDMVDTLTRTK